MPTRWINVGCMLMAGAFMLCSGCGSSQGKPDPTTQATVTGSILNDGKPIAVDSVVTFFCDASSATAGGKIDALGKFSLTSADSKNGIPAGRYKVSVRPPDKVVSVNSSSDDYKKMMMGGGPQQMNSKPTTSSEIPIEFQSIDSTRLMLEVKAGANNFDIDFAKLNL